MLNKGEEEEKAEEKKAVGRPMFKINRKNK